MAHSNRLVTLCHASPRRNVRGILGRGLLPWRALGKLKVVWLHSPARTAWAVKHVAGRHRVEARDVIVFEVEVPRSRIRRRSRGVWTCAAVIPPECILATNGLRLVG
jgi:hypothetical protein